MTSVTSDNDDNDVRAEVVRLHREGVSIRGIAELVGLSKSAVGRIVEADELDLDDDSDLDRDVALLTAIDSGEATPPFRFVGMEPTILHHPGCDDGEPVNVERFLDANGRSVSVAPVDPAPPDRASSPGRRRPAPLSANAFVPSGIILAAT